MMKMDVMQAGVMEASTDMSVRLMVRMMVTPVVMGEAIPASLGWEVKLEVMVVMKVVEAVRKVVLFLVEVGQRWPGAWMTSCGVLSGTSSV